MKLLHFPWLRLDVGLLFQPSDYEDPEDFKAAMARLVDERLQHHIATGQVATKATVEEATKAQGEGFLEAAKAVASETTKAHFKELVEPRLVKVEEDQKLIHTELRKNAAAVNNLTIQSEEIQATNLLILKAVTSNST